MEKLAPIQSTVYVSNFPFSLTNNDLHQIFDQYGKVVKISVVKDKDTRKSKGVAFVLYQHKEDALKCVHEIDKKKLFDREWKASIAKDNGRTGEFTQRRNYPDKSRCYECGEFGHLSYKCPKNALGSREPPAKKKRNEKDEHCEAETEVPDNDDSGLDTLGAAIHYEQELADNRESAEETATTSKTKKFKPSSYFSDEEDLSD